MNQDTPPPPPRRASEGLRGHRSRDTALVLPLAGLALIVPPLVNFFLVDVTVFGAPLIGAYLFGVWAMLILGALWLSRSLHEEEPR